MSLKEIYRHFLRLDKAEMSTGRLLVGDKTFCKTFIWRLEDLSYRVDIYSKQSKYNKRKGKEQQEVNPPKMFRIFLLPCF